MPKPVYVTRPYLPPLEEVIQKIGRIYERAVLTNGGPEEEEFECRVKAFLDVPYFTYVTNGTIALQLAIRALGLEPGEIVTTPFTYVATTSAILWEGFNPIYADIDPDTFNIDPERVERAITPRTRAILPVHVFGHPCDTDAIDDIASRHSLPVIYDAAHAFGVRKNGRAIASYGTLSTFSFHSTKTFHTLEGGGCATDKPDLAMRIERLKRFGHEGDDHHHLGINAKQDEINAAFGNLNLDHLEDIFPPRKRAWELYERRLGDKFRTRRIDAGVDYNYAYFPVLFENEEQALRIISKLNDEDIYPRRYFYPSLTGIGYISSLSGQQNQCAFSDDISRRILCLPLWSAIDEELIERICLIILHD